MPHERTAFDLAAFGIALRARALRVASAERVGRSKAVALPALDVFGCIPIAQLERLSLVERQLQRAEFIQHG